MKYKILSTKKLLPAIVAQAKEQDILIYEQQFISINTIFAKEKATEILQLINAGIKSIVFTSANSVKPAELYLMQSANHQKDLIFFCLSGNTQKTVSELINFLGKIIGTAENAKSLAQEIINNGVREIIFFCGDKRREELPVILKQAGVIVHEIIVYETIETPFIITGFFDAVLFFSPSAVKSFFSVNKLYNQTACFAIGSTTADSIACFTNNKIIISELPTQEVMLATVQTYFKNIKYINERN